MSFTENGTEVRSYIRIHYTSDTLKDYVDGLTKSKTLEDLQAHCQTYQRVADDAFKVIREMKAEDFGTFIKGLRKERKGEFAGEEWAEKYGAVLMPEILMRVGIVADEYQVPWGCAYIRLKDVGRITEPNRIARWNEPTPPSACSSNQSTGESK